MKNDKHFVPDIEDFKIGYEFEKFTQGRIFHEYGFLLPEEERDTEYKWRPCVIKSASDLLHIEAETYMDKPKPFTVPYNEYVRTPYLTTEQIEAEGWEFEWNDGQNGIESFSFLKKDWTLTFSIGWEGQVNSVHINKGHAFYFRGECKSINELRYICKLLKI